MIRNRKPPLNLCYLWDISREFEALRIQAALRDSSGHTRGAALFWGKSALPMARALENSGREPCFALGISPVDERVPEPPRFCQRWLTAEHPFPGKRSFEAGEVLLQFFDGLGRSDVRELTVYLSGGASSLAWIRPSRISNAELRRRLEALYRRPLTIQQINRERSRLCALKRGGAARWLHSLAPRVKARVVLVSDVRPFGPEVVGSGPFWDGRIPHRVLASNQTIVQATIRQARESGFRVLRASSGNLGSWQGWVRTLERQIGARARAGERGIIVFGGEPEVELPRFPGRGGRQTQIAASLLLRFREEIADGRIEILCSSTDGVDGASGAAAAWLNPRVASSCRVKALQRAIRRFDSASELARAGGLLRFPRNHSINLQDVVLARIEL